MAKFIVNMSDENHWNGKSNRGRTRSEGRGGGARGLLMTGNSFSIFSHVSNMLLHFGGQIYMYVYIYTKGGVEYIYSYCTDSCDGRVWLMACSGDGGRLAKWLESVQVLL